MLVRIFDRVRQLTDTETWWETTFLIIGILAILSVLGALFVAAGSSPKTVFTDAEVPTVDSTQFAVALSRLTDAPIEQGGTIEILNNGDEFLPALFASIDSARQSVNFSVYIWEDGTFSDLVVDRLLRRQRQGVSVRILLDGLGAKGAPSDKFRELQDAGARIEKFRTPKFGQLTRLHRRNHRRSIVIDGEVGFTGGMAVSDSWLGRAQDPDHWRDLMFKLTGPPAQSLQSAFADEWVSSSGELLVSPRIYPGAHETTGGGLTRFIHLASSPADDDQSMAYFFLLPILAARHSIHITTPYFIPDKHLKAALERKAREGVDVRLLLPGPHIDNHSARWSGQNHYDDLMQSGVRIYEYQPTFIHSKSVIVDGEWSIIGSPNLNSRSRQLDEENAYGIFDKPFAARLDQVFLNDLQHAREIRLDEWRRRNPLRRIVEGLARLIDQQS